MRRCSPFNEIRRMGHLCEGMNDSEINVQRIAECSHGGCFSLNPNSKSDGRILGLEQLINALTIDPKDPWNEDRVIRLRHSISNHEGGEERSIELLQEYAGVIQTKKANA